MFAMRRVTRRYKRRRRRFQRGFLMFKAMYHTAAAAAFCIGALFAGTASAAVYTSSGTCTVSQVQGLGTNANACFGTVLPVPVNDANTNLNTNTFSGSAVPGQSDPGLFGYEDWTSLGKVDESGGVPFSGTNGNVKMTWDGVISGVAHGTWEILNPGSVSAARIAVVLKQSNTFAAFLFDPALASGTWTTAAFGGQSGSISHLSIYSSGTGTVIPLPAALPLFLAGLAGLGFVGWRRRAA